VRTPRLKARGKLSLIPVTVRATARTFYCSKSIRRRRNDENYLRKLQHQRLVVLEMALRAFSRTIRGTIVAHFTVRAEARTITWGLMLTFNSSRDGTPCVLSNDKSDDRYPFTVRAGARTIRSGVISTARNLPRPTGRGSRRAAPRTVKILPPGNRL